MHFIQNRSIKSGKDLHRPIVQLLQMLAIIMFSIFAIIMFFIFKAAEAEILQFENLKCLG